MALMLFDTKSSVVVRDGVKLKWEWCRLRGWNGRPSWAEVRSNRSWRRGVNRPVFEPNQARFSISVSDKLARQLVQVSSRFNGGSIDDRGGSSQGGCSWATKSP